MKLIAISKPDYFEGEAVLINQLFTAGLPLLQLRKPAEDLDKFLDLMMGIEQQYYPRIAVHQHHDLAEKLGVKRFHLTESHRKSMSMTELMQYKTKGFILSTAVHDAAEIAAVHHFDYVLFGPVFNSISKKGYHSKLDSNFSLAPHTVPVFAIGGVSENKLAILKQMNFDGAAVLGSLWEQADAAPAVLHKLMKHLKIINACS